MKFSKLVLGSALLMSGLFSSVQAAGACDPCDPCAMNETCDICDIDFCNLEFDFFVDALYWQRCSSNLDYSDDDNDTAYINPDWHWGYRLGGYARSKCMDLGFRYTSFCHSDNKSSGGDSKHTFDLDVLDIEFGYTCCLGCGPFSIRPMAGVKLAWIEDKFDKSDNNGSDDKFDFNGYGLYLGLSGRINLCNWCVCDRDIPIALVMRGATGILHSNFDHNRDDGDDRKDECLYVPVHELYLALDFTFCDLCGCGDAFFQIGYEVQNWGGWREYSSSEDLANWGMGGLVLRFGAGF